MRWAGPPGAGEPGRLPSRRTLCSRWALQDGLTFVAGWAARGGVLSMITYGRRRVGDRSGGDPWDMRAIRICFQRTNPRDVGRGLLGSSRRAMEGPQGQARLAENASPSVLKGGSQRVRSSRRANANGSKADPGNVRHVFQRTSAKSSNGRLPTRLGAANQRALRLLITLRVVHDLAPIPTWPDGRQKSPKTPMLAGRRLPFASPVRARRGPGLVAPPEPATARCKAA